MRIHADRSLVPEGAPHAVMLAPFWGVPGSHEEDPDDGRYDRYVAVGRSLFSLVEFDEAEAAVLPVHWESIAGNPAAVAAARDLDERCARVGKPLIVFFISDSVAPVPLEHAIVYRTSLLRSRHAPRDRAMPPFVLDFAAAYAHPHGAPRSWGPRPVVSFCGFAPRPQRLRRVVRTLRGPSDTGLPVDGSVRWRACSVLRRDSRLDTAFIIREAFWGGAFRNGGGADYGTMTRVRQEYVDNIFESDYVLCARGGGNFSYRLYETLATGRIPLFIDTDCVLPFEDEIDWRSVVVWLDERSVEQAADLLLLEHESLRGDLFLRRQRRCREVFAGTLSAEGFFRRLATTRLS